MSELAREAYFMMVRKSKGLGERHQRILEFIQYYQRKRKHPPSIREIGENCGISSTSVVNYYLDQLEKSGHIERDRRISRGLRVTGQTPIGEMFRVPVLGRIQAGEPILVPGSDFNYLDPDESVEIATSLMPPREKGKDLFGVHFQAADCAYPPATAPRQSILTSKSGVKDSTHSQTGYTGHALRTRPWHDSGSRA